MRKILVSFGLTLLIATYARTDDAKPKSTPDEDLQKLAYTKWVHEDPKVAWGKLDERWRTKFASSGVQSWSRIEVQIHESDPGSYSLLWSFFQEGSDEPRLRNSTRIHSAKEEDETRFLVLPRKAPLGSILLQYEFDGERLTLSGSFSASEPSRAERRETGNVRATVFDGVYKRVTK